MQSILEKKARHIGGGLIVLLVLAGYAATVYVFVQGFNAYDGTPWFIGAVGSLIATMIINGGLFIVQPNQAKVLTFFGAYTGTVRQAGIWFANPLATKKSISLRIRNVASQTLKVNDANGNPIEIAAVVVWRVVDSAKAMFSVESYDNFVTIQSETAIRNLATHFPYDSSSDDVKSLRGNTEEIAHELANQLRVRLEPAGVEVVEARLSHLAYAPEIAQAMLRRQQAQAVIDARRLIVEGAVGMVQMALHHLEDKKLVTLDNERKAAMVNNLLVALVSESEAQPVLNAGTLY